MNSNDAAVVKLVEAARKVSWQSLNAMCDPGSLSRDQAARILKARAEETLDAIEAMGHPRSIPPPSPAVAEVPEGTVWVRNDAPSLSDKVAQTVTEYRWVDGQMEGKFCTGWERSSNFHSPTDIRATGCYDEHPPTPPAPVPTAEEVADRCMKVSNPFDEWGHKLSEMRANIVREVTADRDRLARRVAELERANTAIAAAMKAEAEKFQSQNATIADLRAKVEELTESGCRLVVTSNAYIEELNAKLAGGGVDKELLGRELEFAQDLANECDRHPTEFAKGRACGLRDLANNILASLRQAGGGE